MPAIRDEMMSGSMNILRVRIRISPGKLMSMMLWGEKLPSRPKNPKRQPSRTPTIVRTSSRFSFTQISSCILFNEN